jgi:hypothetical protein
MARFMSSLALFSGLMTIMQVTAQIESAQVDIAAGQAYDAEVCKRCPRYMSWRSIRILTLHMHLKNNHFGCISGLSVRLLNGK